jgi:hypothetical protein
LREKDLKYKASLGYTARPFLQNTSTTVLFSLLEKKKKNKNTFYAIFLQVLKQYFSTLSQEDNKEMALG